MSNVVEITRANGPDIATLRTTITDMDALSQEGWESVKAVAGLALVALKSPDRDKHIENVIEALRVICGRADDTMNCVNGEAELVGCNYKETIQA